MKKINIVLLGTPGLNRSKIIHELERVFFISTYNMDEMLSKPHNMTPSEVASKIDEEDILNTSINLILKIPPKKKIVTSSALPFLPGTLNVLRKNSFILHIAETTESILSYINLFPERFMKINSNNLSNAQYLKLVHGLCMKHADQSIQITDSSSINIHIRRLQRKLT